MKNQDERTEELERCRLAKGAVADAIRENNLLGLTKAVPPTAHEVNAEVAAMDFSSWKSVPVA